MPDSTSSPRVRVVGIVQARMGSTRLPGKVLAPLGGSTVLEELLRRLGASRALAEVVVATSTLPADDSVCAAAERSGFRCIRGSEQDVLDRFETAARLTDADVVVRLTADNPLVSGAFVDRCVAEFLGAHPPIDYLETTSNGSFPYGLAVEVLRRTALDAAWAEATEPQEREHVSLFVRQRPARFPALALRSGRADGDLRWTVDTPADLQGMSELYRLAGPRLDAMDWTEIADLWRSHPALPRQTA